MSHSFQPLIRKARPGEEADLHEAHMRSIREVCSKDHTSLEIRGWGNRPLAGRWTEAIEKDFVLVAELAGKVAGVGHIGILPDKSDEAHLYVLYLTPEVLGQGVGFKMAQEMIAFARAKKIKFLRLYSTITAHHFYQKLGFVDVGEMQSVVIGGNPVRCYLMVLELNDA